MQYTPLMTDLVYAIRGRVPATDRHTIKTSNPELLGDLADLYYMTHDVTLRAFIEQLMVQAGATWIALLHKKPAAVQEPLFTSAFNSAAAPTLLPTPV
jgi:hypothetical protein